MTDADVHVDAGAFAHAVVRVAASLARAGVGPGDVVAYQLPNWWEAAVVAHATMGAGAAACAITPTLRESEVGFICEQVEPKLVFAPEMFRGFSHAEMLTDVVAGLGIDAGVVTVRGVASGFERLLESGNADFELADPSPDERALILYTSGTTSVPKGVVHTHATLCAEMASLPAVHGFSADDVILMPMPVTHVAGFEYAILCPVFHGVRAVFVDRWSPERALELVETERVTVEIGAPVFLEDQMAAPGFAEYDTSSMRMISLGGAGVSPELVAATRAAFPTAVVKRTYGSTEHPTVTTSTNAAPPSKQQFTEGRPIGGAGCKLVDGELWTKGPDLFVGYVDAELDADVLVDDVTGRWFRTGDLAAIDDEGYISIVGRLKDIIIRGGENISAEEVEAALVALPEIAEAAVVGVPHPRMGEAVAACVVAAQSIPAEDVLRRDLWAAGLARFKTPERIEWVDELPRNASGKVEKDRLRARLADL